VISSISDLKEVVRPSKLQSSEKHKVSVNPEQYWPVLVTSRVGAITGSHLKHQNVTVPTLVHRHVGTALPKLPYIGIGEGLTKIVDKIQLLATQSSVFASV